MPLVTMTLVTKPLATMPLVTMPSHVPVALQHHVGTEHVAHAQAIRRAFQARLCSHAMRAARTDGEDKEKDGGHRYWLRVVVCVGGTCDGGSVSTQVDFVG